MEKKSFNQRFAELQLEVNLGKTVENSYASFFYRTKEQLNQLIKPIAIKHGITVYTTIDLVEIGGRVFVKATAIAEDIEDETKRKQAQSFAEIQAKAGTKMSEPQLTGSSDSYAGKYALQNLFLVDDNKDPDEEADENTTKIKREDVKRLEKTTPNLPAQELTEINSKIIVTPPEEFTLEFTNELQKAINNLENSENTQKILNKKALITGKIKFNEDKKLWEEA